MNRPQKAFLAMVLGSIGIMGCAVSLQASKKTVISPLDEALLKKVPHSRTRTKHPRPHSAPIHRPSHERARKEVEALKNKLQHDRSEAIQQAQQEARAVPKRFQRPRTVETQATRVARVEGALAKRKTSHRRHKSLGGNTETPGKRAAEYTWGSSPSVPKSRFQPRKKPMKYVRVRPPQEGLAGELYRNLKLWEVWLEKPATLQKELNTLAQRYQLQQALFGVRSVIENPRELRIQLEALLQKLAKRDDLPKGEALKESVGMFVGLLGIYHIANKQPETALGVMRESLRLMGSGKQRDQILPLFASVYWRYGEQARKRGKVLLKAAQEGSNARQQREMAAWLYRGHDAQEKAVRLYEWALLPHKLKDNIYARLFRGKLAFRAKDYNQAIDHFKEATRLAKHYKHEQYEAHRLLAKALLRMNEFDLALKELRLAMPFAGEQTYMRAQARSRFDHYRLLYATHEQRAVQMSRGASEGKQLKAIEDLAREFSEEYRWFEQWAGGETKKQYYHLRSAGLMQAIKDLNIPLAIYHLQSVVRVHPKIDWINVGIYFRNAEEAFKTAKRFPKLMGYAGADARLAHQGRVPFEVFNFYQNYALRDGALMPAKLAARPSIARPQRPPAVLVYRPPGARGAFPGPNRGKAKVRTIPIPTMGVRQPLPSAPPLSPPKAPPAPMPGGATAPPTPVPGNPYVMPTQMPPPASELRRRPSGQGSRSSSGERVSDETTPLLGGKKDQ